MARKKKTQDPEDENVQTQETTNTPDIPDTLNETTAGDNVEEQRDIEGDNTMVTEELPDDGTDMEEILPSTPVPEPTRLLLQKFPNYQELYIDAKGGVYTKDTQPNLVTEAILYQNPYYKQ
jgi:hypothetical protein